MDSVSDIISAATDEAKKRLKEIQARAGEAVLSAALPSELAGKALESRQSALLQAAHREILDAIKPPEPKAKASAKK